MQFLKKHYEKFLLGAVLAGMVGVLVFMLFFIAADKEEMERNVDSLINPPVKALPELDLTTNKAAVVRLQAPYVLNFETGNKVFNPFEWQLTVDNRMIRKPEQGVQLAVATNVVPLYFALSLESVITNELGARYVIKVERQADPSPSKRRPQQRYVSVGDKPNDTFSLLEVKGPPDNPTALVLKLVDTGETVTISRTNEYRRVDDYMGDLRYDPEKKFFRNRRSGDRVSFGGANYLVVEVNQHEMILADQSNQKKTALPFEP